MGNDLRRHLIAAAVSIVAMSLLPIAAFAAYPANSVAHGRGVGPIHLFLMIPAGSLVIALVTTALVALTRPEQPPRQSSSHPVGRRRPRAAKAPKPATPTTSRMARIPLVAYQADRWLLRGISIAP